MTKDALIIGSNIAGLQTTLDLADSGINVHLVEADPFLIKNGDSPDQFPKINTRMLEIARHPNVTVWTNTKINRLEKSKQDFQVGLRQQPRYVDLELCTACGECVEVCPVTVPGSDHKVIFLDGQPGCMAIEKLGVPPCSHTCPGGVHVQGYVALIAQGRFQEAIDLIREAIPFPSICGRVCTHPCEINCRRTEIDAPVSVRLLKRFAADWEIAQGCVGTGENGGKREFEVTASSLINEESKKVSIIGAGPGGMTVADRLARKGYQVTVFDKLPVIGGMMAIGIPGYRLPRDIIAREYHQIQDLGVAIRLNTTIGPNGDHSLDDLIEMGYDAVCLAVGAHQSQSLGIPGEDLPGVVHGIDVLKTISLIHQQNDLHYEVDLLQVLRKGTKTRIAVLGGGNTAIDVARSLKRYNVEDVRILYRRTRAEMPAMPEEVDDAEKEGIALDYLVSPVGVLGDEASGVTGLECIRMELGEPDSSGRRRPVPIEGSEFVVDLDLVVLAIGQQPNLDFLEDDHGIETTPWQQIQVESPKFMTSRPGVFAVGDVVTDANMVVIEAIGMGNKVAEAIDAYLSGEWETKFNVDPFEVQIADRNFSDTERTQKPRTRVATIPIGQRMSSYAEVELGFTAEQAIAEASRCLACGPCSECQACVQVCKPGAIIHNQRDSYADLNVGAIICADGTDLSEIWELGSSSGVSAGEGIFSVPIGDSLTGSAVANQVCLHLNGSAQQKGKVGLIDTVNHAVGKRPWAIDQTSGYANQPDRTGVFICQCGTEGQGEISRVIDTQSIRARAATWPGVIHAEVLPFSCSPDGAEKIDEAVQAHKLNRIVLAGCSCCSIDQVCDSCTFQRIRCKDNLQLFTKPERSSALGTIDQAAKFVLVNIREQCAWVHKNNPEEATSKATALIAGSVARAMTTPTKLNGERHIQKSALILGNGGAVKDCLQGMNDRGIAIRQVERMPESIHHAGGQYIVAQNGSTWKASVLVLSPQDQSEMEGLFKAFESNKPLPKNESNGDGIEILRPGVYLIKPDLNASIAGSAATARVAAWFNQVENQHPISSTVNPTRCRACGTCGEICDIGAPELIEENGHHTSWIDPTLCSGCGTCVAHCPSGAITAGYSTDDQIEAMLSAILARPI